MRTPSVSSVPKPASPEHRSDWEGSSFDDAASDTFQPMSSEAAKAWRSRQPRSIVWILLGYQALAVLLVSGVLWVAALIGLTSRFGDSSLAASFAYGGMAIVLPAALMAVGLQGRMTRRLSTTPTGSLLGFAIWEGFKLLASVGLLVAAPRLVSDLSWFALLAGLLVALKVNWLVVALIKSRQQRGV